MNPFQQAGALKKMWDLKREIEAEELEVEKNGVRIVIAGDQKIKKLETNDKSDDDIKDAVNEAVKKSQEVAAKKLQQMQGGLEGLFGGGK